ncbi:putative MFS family arabinose efflux permease [Prauserella shujinwangii]|uniref:Putative MFS family arabinose efflux permease n=1 Tax=Prauserella shujinwangii TaxID=1453103 RepID=A0A2T0LY44_9PSEU|nr:MFS transporter [Prauserella shujinwangii]PRX49010.1 putative MFS family arabinose efflux permease [Prauserella shujinwangii]
MRVERPVTGSTALGGAYWRLWVSSAMSNLADGVFRVGLPLVAVSYTRSPTLISILVFAMTLPWLLFALPAGALCDRFDRRRIMLGANGVRAGLLALAALAVAHDQGSIWLLFVAALGVGIAETLYDTASQSILPQVVRREQLSRANGRLQAAELTANEFAGPPLGGLLVVAGAAVAIASPAALWAVALGALLLVPGSFRIERDSRTSLRADIAEGLRFLWRHKLLRTLAVMTGVFNFASNATFAILVLYAVGPGSPMGLSGAEFGLLLSASALGGLLGSFVAERIERTLGRARSVALTIGCGTLLVGAPALTSNALLVGGAFVVGGAGIIVWNVITVSLRQRITPDRLLGRVNSGYRLVAWGSRPLGALAGGLVAELLGLRAVFAIMALLALTLLLPCLRVVTDDRIAAAERESEPA